MEEAGKAILVWLSAHPELVTVLMVTVVWPALTGAASYADEWLAERAPSLAAFMRATGFDVKTALRIAYDKARGKVPALPIPPEVLEAQSRASLPPAGKR